MSDDFRQTTRNEGLRVRGDTVAGHVQKSNQSLIKHELETLRGTGQVANQRSALQSALAQGTTTPATKDNTYDVPATVPPEAMVNLLVSVSNAALSAIYYGTKQWSDATVLTGGLTNGPIAITTPGCIKPAQLSTLNAHLQYALATEPQLPQWAVRFAENLVKGYAQAVAMWITSLTVTGLPLFPSGTRSIAWPVSQMHQQINLLAPDSVNAMMLQSGALLNLPSASTGDSAADVARAYVARTAAGMLKFSLVISYMKNLTSVTGTPPVPGAAVIGQILPSSAGILADIGQNLPHPEKYALISSSTGTVDMTLRSDLRATAYRDIGAPMPPTMPPTMP